MTEVVFDSWAWWEVLMGQTHGLRLRRRHLDGGRRVATSALAYGELAAKMAGRVPEETIQAALRQIRASGPTVDVTAELAIEGARLRAGLRRAASHASLGDGIMLATARSLGMRLVSGDAAFSGQKDVARL
jgi:predicted nucleic acid-binding protein